MLLPDDFYILDDVATKLEQEITDNRKKDAAATAIWSAKLAIDDGYIPDDTEEEKHCRSPKQAAVIVTLVRPPLSTPHK